MISYPLTETEDPNQEYKSEATTLATNKGYIRGYDPKLATETRASILKSRTALLKAINDKIHTIKHGKQLIETIPEEDERYNSSIKKNVASTHKEKDVLSIDTKFQAISEELLLETPNSSRKPGMQTYNSRTSLNTSTLKSKIESDRAKASSYNNQPLENADIEDKLEKAAEKSGQEAGVKLHTDPLFQKAEIVRTKNLSKLRLKKKEIAKEELGEIETKDNEEGVLRKKTKVSKKPKPRDISKDDDAKSLLNYYPLMEIDNTPVRKDEYAHLSTKLEAPRIVSQPTQEDISITNASLIPIKRFHNYTPDLWDYIIDCVITISFSRTSSLNTDLNKSIHLLSVGGIEKSSFDVFNPAITPIPVPSAIATPKRAAKGTIATPRNPKKASGHASVMSQGTAQMSIKQKNMILSAKDKLKRFQEEENSFYQEIYRRITLIPVTTTAELDGDRNAVNDLNSSMSGDSTAYLKALFQKFDKNNDGSLSREEFITSMSEMNFQISNDDLIIFFDRFAVKSGAGTDSNSIDWNEFLDFFHSHIGSSLINGSNDSNYTSIPKLLLEMQVTIRKVLAEMEEKSILSLEDYLGSPTKGPKVAAPDQQTSFDGVVEFSKQTPKIVKNPEEVKKLLADTCIFPKLEQTKARSNAENMRLLGLEIAEEEMARISRIFNYDVSSLMKFLRVENVQSSKIIEALNQVDNIVLNGFADRCGLQTDYENSMIKLWLTLSPSKEQPLTFEKASSAMTSVVIDHLHAGSSKNQTAVQEIDETILGVPIQVLCRCVADTLIYSDWNNSTQNSNGQATVKKAPAGKADASSSLLGYLSFSSLDAFVRIGRIALVERKLKYLMQLERNLSSPSLYMLVHVYANQSDKQLIILGHDTISGSVLKLELKDETVSQFPFDDKLRDSFPYDKHDKAKINNKNDFRSWYLYNPWDTPQEDAAITAIINRLRILRTRSSSKFILAEDPKFVSQLKGMFTQNTAAPLPFFAIINDLTMSFEVDEEHVRKNSDGSVRCLVFGALRNHKILHNFLISTLSSMKVVLTTYNSGIRESFSWIEMLSHLTNYRNPFFTVQLLPAPVAPEYYNYRPIEDNSAFTGEEVAEPLAIQRSNVDPDGAPNPTWNAKFKFQFKPPTLTNCKILSTEIASIQIGKKKNYCVVMVREGKANGTPFKFLTLYDPRSATDYQCEVMGGCKLYSALFHGGSVSDCIDEIEVGDRVIYNGENIDQDLKKGEILKIDSIRENTNKNNSNNSEKYTIKAQKEDGSSCFNLPFQSKDLLLLYDKIEDFMKFVGEAADKGYLSLGPTITPRLVIRAYNQNGKLEELLGTCEMSISSVLSGSGISDEKLVTLTYRMENADGTSVEMSAGVISVELGFVRDVMIPEASSVAGGDEAAAEEIIETEVVSIPKSKATKISNEKETLTNKNIIKEEKTVSSVEVVPNKLVEELKSQVDRLQKELDAIKADKTIQKSDEKNIIIDSKKLENELIAAKDMIITLQNDWKGSEDAMSEKHNKEKEDLLAQIKSLMDNNNSSKQSK
eukprot:gene9215-12426_t